MGRQVRFYTLPEDEQEFLAFLHKDPDVAILRDRSKTPELNVMKQLTLLPRSEWGWSLCIWNMRFPINESHIRKVDLKAYDKTQMEFVQTGEVVYCLNIGNAPVIEFSRSFINQDGHLLKGRIWAEKHAFRDGEFFYKGDDFVKWYERVARWLRRNFLRVTNVDGYFGKSALKWYQGGGVLAHGAGFQASSKPNL